MTNINVKMKEPQQDDNLGSFYMGRMRPSAPEKRVLPKGMLTIVTVFAFAAIIWYAYPRGQERYSDMDIPVIQADKTVYKFKPDDPGGMEVLHQDSTVFDPLEKKTADKIDKVRPQPEEPMTKPESAKGSPIDKAPQDLGLAMPHGAEKIISAPEEKPAPAKATASAAKAPLITKAETVKPAAQPSTPFSPVAKAEPPKGEAIAASDSIKSETLAPPPAAMTPAKVILAPSAPAVATAKPAVAAPAKPAPSTASGIYVQFGAYRDAKGAKEEWAGLQKQFPTVLKGLTMRLQENIGPKGSLQRLQAGRLTEARAKDICDALKAGKAACMIVRD